MMAEEPPVKSNIYIRNGEKTAEWSLERTMLPLARLIGKLPNILMLSGVSLTPLLERLNAGRGYGEISATIFLSRQSAIVDALITESDTMVVTLPVQHILDRAFETHARQILLLHTHPSGDPRPSEQDLLVTRRLCARLKPMNIRLMDHIILAPGRYFSFRTHHML